jgi:hypothetical protein
MDLKHRIEAFGRLGQVIRDYLNGTGKLSATNQSGMFMQTLHQAVLASVRDNPWFIEKHVLNALDSQAQMLRTDLLKHWVAGYESLLINNQKPKRVGVIMAGNLPAVGFHDFLCVLMSGHKFIGKTSSSDRHLIPAMAAILKELAPEFADFIAFNEDVLAQPDVVIATGSNNTARYFDYRYGHLPHIFRGNRNGVAVLNGLESAEQLAALAEDIFLYFGLGCRNVSKLYIPKDFTIESLFPHFERFAGFSEHLHYMNNFRHHLALLKMQERQFHENGFLILTESSAFASPVAMVFYEYYDEIEKLTSRLNENREAIQTVVSGFDLPIETIRPGATQQPGLNDYADGVDVMNFLTGMINRE